MSLRSAQHKVAAFHERFAQPIGTTPALSHHDLRASLIAEESRETCDAIAAGDLPGAVDGLADLIYVCLGAAVTWGVDLAPVFDLVHEANMRKAGGGTRADGKILKAPGWTPPDVAGELARQAESPCILTPALKAELQERGKEREAWIKLGAADLAASIKPLLTNSETAMATLVKIAVLVDEALKGVTVHRCGAEDMEPKGEPAEGPAPAGARILAELANRRPDITDAEVSVSYSQRTVALTGRLNGEAITVAVEDVRSVDDAVEKVCAALAARGGKP